MKFILSLLMLVFAYLIGAFIQAEINAAMWSVDARFFTALFGVGAMFMILVSPPDAFD